MERVDFRSEGWDAQVARRERAVYLGSQEGMTQSAGARAVRVRRQRGWFAGKAASFAPEPQENFYRGGGAARPSVDHCRAPEPDAAAPSRCGAILLGARGGRGTDDLAATVSLILERSRGALIGSRRVIAQVLILGGVGIGQDLASR